MQRSRLLVLVTLCLFTAVPTPVCAGEGAGTSSPLEVGVGARSLAMGRAASALATGPEALLWNPALLARIPRPVASLFHSDLYTDQTALQSGFVAYPTLDFGVFGLGVQRLGVGGIDARDDRNLSLGEFDASEIHVRAGYGRSWPSGVQAGLAVKIVQQNVQGTGATGAGVDLGVAYERPLASVGHFLDAGLVLQNAIAPTLRLDEEEVADPRRLKLGLGHRWDAPDRRVQSALAVEFEWPAREDTRWGLGTEVGLDHTFFLRGGLDDGRLAAGFGIHHRGVQFGYALRSDEDLPREDRFSLTFAFGPSLEDRRAERRRQREEVVAQRLAQMLGEREAEALARARAEAGSAYDDADWERAELLYKRVLLLDPDDAEASIRVDDARRRRALAAAEEQLLGGSAAAAVVAFQRILEQWPADPRAEEGLERARSILTNNENRRETLRELFADALARFADGDLAGAEASLTELLRLDPRHEGGRELAARVKATRKARLNEALDRSDAELAQGRFDRALQWLQRARSLAPEFEGEWARRQARIEEARDAAQRALEAQRARVALRSRNETAGPPSSASTPAADPERLREGFDAGMRAFQRGNYETAVRRWREVWELSPSYGQVASSLVKAYQLLGIQAYTGGDYTRAIENCRRALEIDPDDEKSRRYLARIEEERASVEEIDAWRSNE